jgi:hypothetical protein
LCVQPLALDVEEPRGLDVIILVPGTEPLFLAVNDDDVVRGSVAAVLLRWLLVEANTVADDWVVLCHSAKRSAQNTEVAVNPYLAANSG